MYKYKNSKNRVDLPKFKIDRLDLYYNVIQGDIFVEANVITKPDHCSAKMKNLVFQILIIIYNFFF